MDPVNIPAKFELTVANAFKAVQHAYQ